MSYKEEILKLNINQDNSTHASYLSLARSKNSISLNTPAISLDSLNLDRLDFIKIDAEGWEHKVLLGAEKTIERFKPAIFIELLIDFYHIINLLQVMGYILVKAFKINNYFFIHESKVKDVNQLLMGRKV